MPLKTIYKYIKLNVVCHHTDLVLVCLALVIVFVIVLPWWDLNYLLLCPISMSCCEFNWIYFQYPKKFLSQRNFLKFLSLINSRKLLRKLLFKVSLKSFYSRFTKLRMFLLQTLIWKIVQNL